ncbi:MAG: hypothetical protein JWL85_65 [Candidatus Saccharibacteria bacterium]|nr:hypothetical protein [Candidatus Saccharibacteria bacterium]
MTINRLSIPEGTLIPEGQSPYRAVARLLLEHADAVIQPAPGEYEVTPPSGEVENLFTHKLTIHDNGEGTFQMLPKEEDASTVDINLKTRGLSAQKGGSIRAINAERSLLLIGGGGRGSNVHALRLFEIIFFTE